MNKNRDIATDSRLRPLLHDLDIDLAIQPIVPVPPVGKAETDPWVEMLIRPRRKGKALSAQQLVQRISALGVAREFDLWVIRRTLCWLSGQQETRLCSINVSGQSISQRIFLRQVLAEFEKSGVDPHRICFEVTETDPVTNFVSARAFAKVMRGIGCKMALDDFGGGVSNILLLIHKEMDYLKIDGRFVRRMRSENNSFEVVCGLVAMSRVIGLKVVAESVETEAQFQRVQQAEVPYLQGFLFGEPKVLTARDLRGRSSSEPARR